MMNQITVDDVWQKLMDSDSRIREIAEHGRIDSRILISLLLKEICVTDPKDFHFRYIGTGKSNSEVLLLVEVPGGLRVIKCGPRQEIEKELRHFDKSLRPRALALRMKSRFRPIEFSISEPINDGNKDYVAASSRVVGDCKAVETLRSALENPNFKLSHLLKAIGDLGSELANWQQSSTKQLRSPDLPFGHFPWFGESQENIVAALNAFGTQYGGSVRLELKELVTNPKQPPRRWLDMLKGVEFSRIGVCHGDLNSQNVLMGLGPNSQVEPFLVDFAWASEGEYSPALDWAKLERDIKLRGMRDATGTDTRTFARQLRALNASLRSGDFLSGDDTHAGKSIGLIHEIRRQYFGFFAGPTANIEYLYYLLCWNLAYLNTDDFKELTNRNEITVLNEIVSSVVDTFQILDKSVADFASPKAPAIVTSSGTPDNTKTKVNLPKKSVWRYRILVFLVSVMILGAVLHTIWKPTHPEVMLHGVLIDSAGQPLPHVKIGLAAYPAEAATTSPLACQSL